MHLTDRGRRRRTREQVDQLLEDYYRSGLTQRGFAREHDISLSTLQRWLNGGVPKANRFTPAVEPTWVEVAATPAPVRPVAPRSYRVDLPGGISLRVDGGFDAAELEQLLRVLR